MALPSWSPALIVESARKATPPASKAVSPLTSLVHPGRIRRVRFPFGLPADGFPSHTSRRSARGSSFNSRSLSKFRTHVDETRGFIAYVIEPLADVHRQSPPFEEIEHRTAEAFAEPIGRAATAVPMREIVFGKALKCRSEDTDAVTGRHESHRTVSCGGEAMPKGGLDQICRKQLAYPFE